MKNSNGETTAISTDQAGMPHNEDAEQAVLGAILIDNAIIPDVTVTLSETAFYSTKNRVVFNAIKDAWENGGVADQVTVTMHLQDAGKLDGVGQAYVAELAGETATSANWKAHAKILTDHRKRREMIVLAQKLNTIGRSGGTESGLEMIRDYLDRVSVDPSRVDWDDMPTVGVFVKSVGEDVDYLLDGLIVDNSTTILAAEAGAGKSIWAFGLSYAIATGEPFLGREVTPGGVLYFDYEMAENMLSWRLGAYARGMGVDIDAVDNFRIKPFATDTLSTEAGINMLAARIAGYKPSLIVFDTMRRVMGSLKENTSDDMAQILQALNHIKARTRHNFSVLYLHHTIKDKEAKGLDRLRGSSDLAGQVDLVLIMDRFGDERIVIDAVKKRHGEPFRETYRMLWTKTDVKIELTDSTDHSEGETNGETEKDRFGR